MGTNVLHSAEAVGWVLYCTAVLHGPVNFAKNTMRVLHPDISVLNLIPRTAFLLVFAFHYPSSLAETDNHVLLLFPDDIFYTPCVLSEKETREKVLAVYKAEYLRIECTCAHRRRRLSLQRVSPIRTPHHRSHARHPPCTHSPSSHCPISCFLLPPALSPAHILNPYNNPRDRSCYFNSILQIRKLGHREVK